MKGIIILVFALFLNFLALSQENIENLKVKVKHKTDVEKVEKLTLKNIEKVFQAPKTAVEKS